MELATGTVISTTGSSPWWAVPLLSGLFVFVGVVLAQVVGLYTSRKQAQREDITRWHAERRTLYSHFTKELRDAIDMIELDYQHNKPPEETIASFSDTLSAYYEEITFLASAKVINAASEALSAAEQLAVAGQDNDDPLPRSTYFDTTMRARRIFVEEARQELGITKPERKYSISSDSILEILRTALVEALPFPFK